MGAGVMYLVPRLFQNNYGNQNNYRSSIFELETPLNRLSENILYCGRYTIGCVGIWLLISALMIYLILKEKSFCGNSVIKRSMQLILYIAVPVISFVCILDVDQIVYPPLERIFGLFFVVEVIYLINAAVIMWKNRMWRSAWMIGGAIVAAAPLLFVSPISPRTFYLTFFCLLGAGISALNDIVCEENRWERECTLLCYTAGLAMMVMLSVIAGDWKYADLLRMKYFERATAQKEEVNEIALPCLPHSRFLQADADSNYWEYVLKYQWGMDKDADLRVIIRWYDWYNWLNIKREY